MSKPKRERERERKEGSNRELKKFEFHFLYTFISKPLRQSYVSHFLTFWLVFSQINFILKIKLRALTYSP